MEPATVAVNMELATAAVEVELATTVGGGESSAGNALYVNSDTDGIVTYAGWGSQAGGVQP